MTGSTLNIGILAHVDAGKTSLTERLLFHTGAIATLGSVDGGTTRTDTLALERERGITIRSAVVTFAVGDRTVNVIDTPGHSDFVAEVERALGVLDGAVLVVSAVEGVQAQTRVLMRTLRRLGVPVLLFVNKVDRMGARPSDVLAHMASTLTPGALAMARVSDAGTKHATVHPVPVDVEVLAGNDDVLLESCVLDEPIDCHKALVEQTAAGLVHPVFFGSAATGAGVELLVDGIRELLPVSRPATDALLGTVFAIERTPSGEKLATVRLRGGDLVPRQQVAWFHRDASGVVAQHRGKVTGLRVFGAGGPVRAATASAGQIVQVAGLTELAIGDQLGGRDGMDGATQFAPPTLQTVVRAASPDDDPRVFPALQRLAEQDPLIDVRRDDGSDETTVLLYGEVQKEVLAERLAREWGLVTRFSRTSTVHIERPAGPGASMEHMGRHGLGFFATIGFRVDPAPAGAGIAYRLEVELGCLPLAFHTAIEQTAHCALRQGLYGWRVTDCVVSLTHAGYASPVSTAADFRKLTPVVLLQALRAAGTRVFEPTEAFELDVPADTVGPVLAMLTGCGAVPGETTVAAAGAVLRGSVPSRLLPRLRQRLPGVTRGEGVLVTRFGGYRQVLGAPPAHARTDGNPLDRTEYLLHLSGRT